MQTLSFVLLSCFCFVVPVVAVPPSPAGGGYFQIYAPGDYTYVKDHDDFDAQSLLKNGFTIEMWFYVSQPLKEINTAIGQPYEKWMMLYKADNYELGLLPTGTPFSNGRIGPGETLPLNQWHYVAVMYGKGYFQQAINIELRHTQGGVLRPANTDSPLCIGGGLESPISTFPGAFLGKQVWTPFTNGFIDEVRVSNIVRYPKPDKGKRRIKVPVGPFEPDAHTVALWHFDSDGSPGSKWRDASGNGHHLTYHGDYLGVEPTGKLSVIWGELKRQ